MRVTLEPRVRVVNAALKPRVVNAALKPRVVNEALKPSVVSLALISIVNCSHRDPKRCVVMALKPSE